MLIHTKAPPVIPKRVVALGARGFVARHLQEWCVRRPVSFIAVGSDTIDLSVDGNAAKLAALLQPGDAVVMTSGINGKDEFSRMSNLRMAETVCLALKQTRCAHFVYLSSDAVYDARKLPINEDSSREADDFYARAHAERETMLDSALQALKIPLCILRLTAIYGPGFTKDTYGPNRFVRSALMQKCIELKGRGEELRSHLFIADAVALIGRVLEHASTGTLNVATAAAVSFSDVAGVVARLAGVPVTIKYGPRSVPFMHRTFDNAAVWAAFPDFRFISLEEGLLRFIAAERGEIGAAQAVQTSTLTTAVRAEG
jgi:UDP-glucose 4-epimerase